jgi:hypothetical protein
MVAEGWRITLSRAAMQFLLLGKSCFAHFAPTKPSPRSFNLRANCETIAGGRVFFIASCEQEWKDMTNVGVAYESE